jgi:hypothetical protein
MTTTSMPLHTPWAGRAATERGGGKPSVGRVLGALGRNLTARARVSALPSALLDVGGLGAITYGAGLWTPIAGWIIGGLSAIVLSARLSA